MKQSRGPLFLGSERWRAASAAGPTASDPPASLYGGRAMLLPTTSSALAFLADPAGAPDDPGRRGPGRRAQPRAGRAEAAAPGAPSPG